MKVNLTVLESSATFHSPAEAPNAARPAQTPTSMPKCRILFIHPVLDCRSRLLTIVSGDPASATIAAPLLSACIQVRCGPSRPKGLRESLLREDRGRREPGAFAPERPLRLAGAGPGNCAAAGLAAAGPRRDRRPA